MKEIVLSVKRQKTEIKIFCVCIALVAFTDCRLYSVCCIMD